MIQKQIVKTLLPDAQPPALHGLDQTVCRWVWCCYLVCLHDALAYGQRCTQQAD